jgi:hypothetical protein
MANHGEMKHNPILKSTSDKYVGIVITFITDKLSRCSFAWLRRIL